MPEDAARKPPDKSRRAVILATVGIVVILGLAVFYVAVVAPLRQTHRIVRKFGEACARERVSTVMYQQAEATQRLGGPDRAADRITRYLRLPGWINPDRVNAMRLLGWCGPCAVPALVQALGEADRNVRCAAARALGQMGDLRAEGWGGWKGKESSPVLEAAVPALIKVLGDAEADLRFEATVALSGVGREAVPALVGALDNPNVFARHQAALALGRIGPKAREAVPALERLLADKNAFVRAAAAEALEEIRGPAPVPTAPAAAPAPEE